MMRTTLCLIFIATLLPFCLCYTQNVEIVILGIAQDAGYPQANCQLSCCNANPQPKMVSSIGIVDNSTGKTYMIDCTPDFKNQLKMLSNYSYELGKLPAGIFLTHAHMGHYLGLAQLGREVINAKEVPVYAMPKMTTFLKKNGPWGQLVSEKNIDLKNLSDGKEIVLSEHLKIKPIIVPHRDEYSETVGFVISSGKESLLYIPDINKWEKWDNDIVNVIKEVDYALLDGTFYQDGEIPGRNMKDIPHPFVVESIKTFADLPALEKAKIHFTHLNHTNPLLDKKSTPYRSVYLNGFNVASEGLSFYLN